MNPRLLTVGGVGTQPARINASCPNHGQNTHYMPSIAGKLVSYKD